MFQVHLEWALYLEIKYLIYSINKGWFIDWINLFIEGHL